MSAQSRPLYYLVSTAGFPNLGDELMPATWLRYLAEVAPDADVVLDCINPASVAAPMRDLHPRVQITSALWQLCFRHWDLGIAGCVEVAAAVADPSRAEDLRSPIELLRRASVVHMTGGGFLNVLWPTVAGLLAGIVTATRRSGGTAAMTGVGLAPGAPGAQDLLHGLVSQLDVADVRDEASAQLLGKAAGYSCDDVFLDPTGWLAGQDQQLPEVMVSLQLLRAGLFPPSDKPLEAPSPEAEVGMNRLIDFISKTLDEWGVREVGLVECWPDADSEILELATDRLPVVRRYSLHDMLAEGIPACPGQTWLSTRFHPHLFAAAASASGIALNLHDDYYGTKHRSLTAQGSRWEMVNCELLAAQLPEIPQRPTAGGFTADELAGLRAAKTRVADAIYRGQS